MPLKLQVGIRDSWDKADAPVQAAIKKLKEVIGVRVTVNPEWSILHTELGPFYPDKAAFVPSVAGAVEACCDALSALVDEDANIEWVNALLEHTDHIHIFIEISKNRVMSVSWSDQREGFIVYLPKSVVPSQSYMQAFFMGNLVKVFDEKSRHDALTKLDAVAADDWADVAVDDRTGNAAVLEVPQRHVITQQSPAFDIIPDVEILSRPDELLLKPPYHLIMRSSGKTHVDVECSHSPTLELLEKYVSNRLY
ncbi:hypothetical protein NUW58_g1469 [Xylaria curta]|uniref:Uncharacterized protein n=1 Tax=Xylaria curta TaxID=42375 RepID=A0ACC1PML6_9PEZI|nr:hypothetical protein NUW58_g1469 [Xylaria curta]